MYSAPARASSTSFSGNCGAKFGRKLKNLSETTADDTDNIDRQLRVTDDVCEQHMRDLQLDFFFDLGGHTDLYGNSRHKILPA
jgi:hypothetical protein